MVNFKFNFFRSSEDLLQRLFVCISGVADQLQTNFAGDLRNILKAVFLINASDRTQFDTVDTRTTSSYFDFTLKKINIKYLKKKF